MNKYDYILENLDNMLEQNNISMNNLLIYYLLDRLNIHQDPSKSIEEMINKFKLDTQEDCDLIWDYYPTLEEDEEHSFAIQHICDIMQELLFGGNLYF